MEILFLLISLGLGLGMALDGPGDSMAAASTAAPAAAAETAAPAFEAEDQTPSGKFMTAGEVRMILDATKPQWIAVRPYEGQDLLYFTNLLAWRCGLHQIRYSVNGGDFHVLEAEPCYAEEPTPNALKVDTGILPYVTLPLESVQTIDVEVLYDDLSVDSASYDRASVQIN